MHKLYEPVVDPVRRFYAQAVRDSAVTMYDWAIYLDIDRDDPRRGPSGITETEDRARTRVAEALATLPPNVEADGEVVKVRQDTATGWHEIVADIARAERGAQGSIVWVPLGNE